jgi:hypothetical protein
MDIAINSLQVENIGILAYTRVGDILISVVGKSESDVFFKLRQKISEKCKISKFQVDGLNFIRKQAN